MDHNKTGKRQVLVKMWKNKKLYENTHTVVTEIDKMCITRYIEGCSKKQYLEQQKTRKKAKNL